MYQIIKKDENGKIYTINRKDKEEVASHLTGMCKITPNQELIAVIKLS